MATRSQMRPASSRRCVVRDDRDATLTQPVDQYMDAAGSDQIEAGRRLVEEQNLRLADRRPRQSVELGTS
jgi:hypothetical protein